MFSYEELKASQGYQNATPEEKLKADDLYASEFWGEMSSLPEYTDLTDDKKLEYAKTFDSTFVNGKDIRRGIDSSNIEDRGFVGDSVSHLARGGVALLETTAHAANVIAGGNNETAKKAITAVDGLRDRADFLKPDEAEIKGEDGFVKRGWNSAMESLPESAAIIPAAMGGAAIGGAVGGPFAPVTATIGGVVGGGAALLGLFGAGQYGMQKEEASKKIAAAHPELSPEAVDQMAHENAMTYAKSEVLGEGAGDLAGYLVFSRLPGGKVLYKGGKAVLKELVQPGAVKTILGGFAKDLPFEVGSEVGTSFFENEADKKVGIATMSTKAAMAEAILPAIFLSSGMGVTLGGYNTYQRNQAYSNLNTGKPEERAQRVNSIAGALGEATDESVANKWQSMAMEYVAAGKDIPLDYNVADLAAERPDGEKPTPATITPLDPAKPSNLSTIAANISEVEKEHGEAQAISEAMDEDVQAVVPEGQGAAVDNSTMPEVGIQKESQIPEGSFTAAKGNTFFSESALKSNARVKGVDLSGYDIVHAPGGSGFIAVPKVAQDTLSGFGNVDDIRAATAEGRNKRKELRLASSLSQGTMEQPSPQAVSESSAEQQAATSPEIVSPNQGVAAQNGEVVGDKQAPELIEHTTGKGKILRGIVVATKEEAKAIDPYTFKKDGGWFVKEKYLTKKRNDPGTKIGQTPDVSSTEDKPDVVAQEPTGEALNIPVPRVEAAKVKDGSANVQNNDAIVQPEQLPEHVLPENIDKVRAIKEDENGIIPVRTTKGQITYIKKQEYLDVFDKKRDRRVLKMFKKNGERIYDNGIHIANIDPTGLTQKQLNGELGLPEIWWRSTKKGDYAFSSISSAKREITKKGWNDTHEAVEASSVVPGSEGYLIKMKAAISKAETSAETPRKNEAASQEGDQGSGEEQGEVPAEKPKVKHETSSISTENSVDSEEQQFTDEQLSSTMIEVDVDGTDEKVVVSAKELLEPINKDMELYKKLLDCVGA